MRPAEISPKEFRKRVAELLDSQRLDLLRALGKPPDLKKIPKGFWEKARKERELLLAALLMSMSYMFAQKPFQRLEDAFPEVREEDLIRRLRANAKKRSKWVSRVIGDYTKELLSRKEELKRSEISDLVFPESRVKKIQDNEFMGSFGVANASVRETAEDDEIPVEEVWMLGDCEHCDFCPMLHKTPREFWSRFVKAPPAHVNCCCTTVLYFGEEADHDWLIHRGLLRRRLPPVRSVRAAADAHGVRRR